MSNFHIFFLNWIDQLETVQPVRRARALFLLILGTKSYLVRAHKPQISPRHGLGLVLSHVMCFLQPTLGPLGYKRVGSSFGPCYASCFLLPLYLPLMFTASF